MSSSLATSARKYEPGSSASSSRPTTTQSRPKNRPSSKAWTASSWYARPGSTDPAPARQGVALARELERKGVACDLDADELSIHAPRADRLERGLADVVRLLLLDEPLEAGDVERRVIDRHVRAIVEDARLDPASLARRDRPDAVRLARLEHAVPQVATARRVAQVDLIADLARPAGPADHDGNAVDLGRERPVVLDVVDGEAEDGSQRVARLRAL